MDSFDNMAENWATYVERVAQSCLTNEISNEGKSAVLLSVLDVKTYNWLCSLISPTKSAEKPFDKITQMLKKHINATPLVVAEHFRFHKRNQSKTEYVSEYMAKLRRLAEHC